MLAGCLPAARSPDEPPEEHVHHRPGGSGGVGIEEGGPELGLSLEVRLPTDEGHIPAIPPLRYLSRTSEVRLGIGWVWHPLPVDFAPIGTVRSSRTEPVDDDWDSVRSSIELDQDVVSPDATVGLGQFSHVEVVYLFDRVDSTTVERGSRHPRGNPDWPRVGILAQRARNRPNRIGLTCCRLVSVEGLVLHLRDLDAVDGTPVLDVKPWMEEFGPKGPVRQPAWSTELMDRYWSTSG